MAAGWAGDDEGVSIKITSDADVADALKAVRELDIRLSRLGDTLRKVSASGNKGLHSVFNNKQMDAANQRLKAQIDLVNKLAKASDQETKSAKKVEAAIAAEAKAVEKLTGQYKKAVKQKEQFTSGYSKRQKDDFKAWQKQMASAGTAIVGQPKSIEMARNNIRSLRENLTDLRKAGIANKGTLDSLEKGTASAFTRGLTSGERFRIMLGVIKKDAHSLFKTMELGAKNMQWTGMQMMQGMTLPIIGMGVIATNEFDKFNKQMFQLKKVTEFRQDYQGFRQDIEDVASEFGLMPSVVAGAFKDVAALGITGREEIGLWVREISKLSVLGDMEAGAATDFVRSISALFDGGGFERTPEILANLNAIADSTSLQLGELAEAFPKAAPVMKQLSFNANEVAASLAAMHTQGIDASEGANALKSAMFKAFGGISTGRKELEKLGITMFDTNGQISDGTASMLALAARMEQLSDEQGIQSMYNLIGIHQGSRVQAYFDDMLAGYREISAAMEDDGKLRLEEVEKFRSGWAKAMATSGELGPVEGLDTAKARYDKALEEYQKDPSKQLAQFKSNMSMFMIKLGELIIPALNSWQEKFMGFLNKIMALPAALKKGIVVVALMAAAMGPLIYATAQAGLAISTFGRVATKVLPSTFKDITDSTARRLFKEDPNRTDIGQVGNRVVQFKKQRRMGSDMKQLTEAQYEAAVAAGVLEKSSDGAADAIDDVGDEARQTSKRLDQYQAKMYAGASAGDRKKGESIRRSIEDYKKNLARLDDPNDMQIMSPMARAKAIESQKKLLRESLDEFDDHAKKSYVRGQLVGTNYSRGMASSLRRFSPKTILSNMTGRMGRAGAAFKNAPMFDGIKIYTSEMRRANIETSKSIGGMKGKILGFGKAGAIGFGGAAKGLAGMLLKLGAIGAVLAVVAGIAMTFYIAIKNTEGAGEKIKKKLQPAIEKLKESFALLIASLKEVLSVIGGVIGGFDGSAQSSEKAADTISWIGDALAKVVELFSIAVRAAAAFIYIMRPIWEALGYMIKNVMGIITSLIQGDWQQAFIYFAAFAYEGIRPVIIVFEALLDVVLVVVKGIVNLLGLAGQAIAEFIAYSTLGMLDFTDQVANARTSMSTFFDDIRGESMVDYFDQLRDLPNPFGDNKSSIFDSMKDVGKGVGDKVAEGVEESTAGNPDAVKGGENIADAVEDGLGKGLDISEFLGKVKSALDEEIAKLRDSIMKSFEDAHKAEIASLDAKLKAIDDIEKAEEKLYAEQEYLQRKREMLYRRSIDMENYQRDRALAIYEGRTDDARMLDLEHEKNTHDFNKEMGDLEEQRRREIVKQQREEEREIINKQKSIAEERYEVAREGLERELAEITKYTPRTMAEMNSMLSQISGVMKDYHINDIPITVQTGTDLWSKAIKTANEQMIHDFAWSGETAITGWLAAFIDPEVLAVLIARATEMKDGYNDQINQIDPITSDDILDPDAPNAVTDMLGGLGDSIQNAIGNIGEATRQQLSNAAKQLVVGIADLLLSFAELVVRSVGAMINGVARGAANIAGFFGVDTSSWGFNVEGDIANARAGFEAWKRDYLGVGLYNGGPLPGLGGGGYVPSGMMGPPSMATGGITSGPTITGEGSNPREYVIPMDPRYRSNAISLTSSLLKELGLGGTYNMPSTNAASINKSISSAGAAAASAAGATIYVDTFIGEEEWFKKLADQYDMKVGKKKASASGSAKRVIKRYNDNNRGAF